MKKKSFITGILFIYALTLNAQKENKKLSEIGIWDKFELEIQNNKNYDDPFRDVELLVEFTHHLGRKVSFWGFYNDNNTWKVRFMPDEYGLWSYKAWFSDGSHKIKGKFKCVNSDIPGQVNKDELNPFWLGYKGGKHELFRSFHVGDCFFAENWDNPVDNSDGNKRKEFLDWIQQQDYNMLSIASHYLNRQAEGRGKGWDTPVLWPLDPTEYAKMEIILDDLKERKIIVFPFAGFFGAQGNWPTEKKEQELYIKYTLARLGHYWNIILNIAGPEPLWFNAKNKYQGAMRLDDIKRIGSLIDSLDVYHHILTVHNEKKAVAFGDPFIDEPWYDMSTLQGPTTTDIPTLYSGLSMNHHNYKPMYAQETLWSGNKYHVDYSDDQLRKNAYTILFAGGILNFADMNGNSSSGFSGTLDLNECNQDRHDIIKKVWDWFETIPFYQMVNRQDFVMKGYCLASEGKEYYIYSDTIGEIELFIDFPHLFSSQWINAKNPQDVRTGPEISGRMTIKTPQDGDDWILHIYAL